ncbi:MAG TPA: hypothetical protein VG986_07120 [Pseudolabrys sp.]|nr:hypothetical protein [Pseudolabrys sp.]
MTSFRIDKPASRTARARARFRWLQVGFFPLAVLAFCAVGVRHFNTLFTTTSRWIFLALLIASLVPKGRILQTFKYGFSLPLVIYLMWCLSTTVWSEVPDLSLLKAAALALSSMALVAGGSYWSSRYATTETLHFLLPVVLLALAAGIGGVAEPQDVRDVNEFVYGGLAGNPNFLGTLLAISLPFAIYFAYRAFYRGGSGAMRFLSLVLGAALCLMLMRSGSRASMLCAAVTVFSALMALTANKKIAIITTGVFGILAVILVVPQVQQHLYEHYVLKGSTEKEGVFFSRYQPWEESYRAALQGGYVGVGYGVTAGQLNFDVGLTAQTYGREKGNAQLAVWEETGLVGLALYAILLVAIFRRFFRAFGHAKGELKILIAIVGGVAMGLTVQSVFEAWWTAPGSIQSAAFWAFVGVGAGLVKQIEASRREARARVASARRAQLAMPPGAPGWRGSAAS